jgi:hypothetical protein
MEKVACSTCFKPKANLECACCHEPVCKNCAQFLEENRFSFLATVPEILQGSIFCPVCFDSKIQPEIQAYEADIERAREVIVFFKKQTKETRHVKRLEQPVVVEHCPDREETLLRLAYFAIKAGFQSLVDVEISSVKIRSGSRQFSDWSGTGVPADVDLSKIPKDRSIRFNPN